MASRSAAAARVVETKESKPVRKKRRVKKAPPERSSEHRVAHEVLAVFLCCGGLLTLLALASYSPEDASLNAASSRSEIHNWIGPAGAYWSDLMLQLLGVGAYALAFGSVLAGWRSLVGHRVLPGFREALGTLLLVAFAGAFAELWIDPTTSFPAGGVGGAILARILVDNFAVLGAGIITGALLLVALAITIDGVLRGLGLRGLSIARDGLSWIEARWIVLREQRRHAHALRAERREQASVPAPDPDPARSRWSWNETKEKQRAAERDRRVEEAKARGEKLAAKRAERERERERERELRRAETSERSGPQLVLDQTVDLPREEHFELGKPPLEEDDFSVPEPSGGASLDDGELKPVSIRAADPSVRKGVGESVRRGDGIASRAESDSASQSSGDGVQVREPRVKEPVVDRAPAARKSSKGKRADPSVEPEIVDVRPDVDADHLAASDELVSEEETTFELPSTALLDFKATERAPIDPAKLRENAQRLVRTLKEYKIDGTIREIRPGPVVTMYEFVPAPGIKISRIAGLADDIAMSMAAMRVRIVAPIPGKGAVGIEIPNDDIETVFYKEIISNDAFKKAKSRLTIALGKDIEGKPVVANLAKMPHLLVAGATGAGKSVSVNAMIMSILFKATPAEVRFIMVDPKMLELSVYNGIPHLLLPVVTDPKKASLALRWAVEEMERRYKLLSDAGVKNIDGFNNKVKSYEDRGEVFALPPEKDGEPERPCEQMPYIVVVVDELADLMMVASREVESSIMRMAQMARAAGIHLILATQRPSVDVITGSIKANLPTRIAFRVAQKNDSRTILDQNGAQNLLGRGDMLFMSNGAAGLQRVHGAFVNEEEVERTVEFIKEQGKPRYDESILKPRGESEGSSGGDGDEDRDEMYDRAVAIVTETRQASISMIQRKLKIGYNRAARMVEMMESEGIVGPPDGAKPRQVLAPAPPEV